MDVGVGDVVEEDVVEDDDFVVFEGFEVFFYGEGVE